MLTEPERLHLARLDTPLESYSGLLPNRTLLVKRDDLTGSGLSGNKIRKLEYLVADALQRGYNRLVTCGGIQSNHCRATVIAAARTGLKSRVYLRTNEPPEETATKSGNLALMSMAGADIQFVPSDWYADRVTQMAALAEDGDYLIPEGGSNALGAWGYIRAASELVGQWHTPPTSIIAATGSGGTIAGLTIGMHREGFKDVPVYGVCACDDSSYFQAACAKISANAHKRWPELPRLESNDFRFIEGYVGRGYALWTPEEMNDLKMVMRTTGLVLDPVYTNKAFQALLREPELFGTSPLFIHTGGIFGLLA
jgi:D-cysteine desulfhydrase